MWRSLDGKAGHLDASVAQERKAQAPSVEADQDICKPGAARQSVKQAIEDKDMRVRGDGVAGKAACFPSVEMETVDAAEVLEGTAAEWVFGDRVELRRPAVDETAGEAPREPVVDWLVKEQEATRRENAVEFAEQDVECRDVVQAVVDQNDREEAVGKRQGDGVSLYEAVVRRGDIGKHVARNVDPV